MSTDGSSNVNLFTEAIYRKPKVYLYGVAQSPVLEFPITLNTPEELDADDLQRISKWLFGRKTYAKLQIVQPDMQYTYYNCFFTNPKVQRVGSIIRGIEANVVCDSPFAWEFTKNLSYNYTDDTVSSTLTFNNTSDDLGYLYPSMTFTGNTIGGGLIIVNANDNSRSFEYDNLVSGEIITINNELQTISTSRGIKILSNFNKKWLRFVQGVNVLSIQGNISNMTLQYQFARKSA